MRLTLALMLFATQINAQCGGTDLRPSLPENIQAELHDTVQQTPFAEGNHWLAKKGNQKIHILGTMHVNDRRMQGPAKRIEPIVAAADIILLEMDKAEQEKLQSAVQTRPEMLLLTQTSLPELMPEEEWQKLAQAARDRGIPAVMAAKFQPWYLSMMLAIPPCMMSELTEQQGLDHQIMAMAQRSDTPTAALEPFDTIFNTFNSEDLETQIEFLSLNLPDAKQSEDMMATMRAVYFDEQSAQAWQLSRLFADIPPADRDAVFAEMEQGVLIDRNVAWIDVIATHKDKGTILIAVGAAHLPGDQGVLNLLAQQGYSLTRQPF